MSKLDDKLKGLDLEFLHGVPVHLTDAMIAQIKQAFADEGYSQLVNSVSRNHLYGGITASINTPNGVEELCNGQEWYARLEQQINSAGLTFQPGDTGSNVVEAAKRAAGMGGQS